MSHTSEAFNGEQIVAIMVTLPSAFAEFAGQCEGEPTIAIGIECGVGGG